MAKVYTHPHWETHVIDRSIYQPLRREILPLFLPIFFARMQQGDVGVPIWTPTYNDAIRNWGEGSFDEGTKFFSRESLYMKKLFARQGCFVVRIAGEKAQYGSLVLQLRVKKKMVKQYMRDKNGQFVLDENTHARIPLVDPTTKEHITEPGVELKWTTRPMVLTGNRPETIANLKPTTYGSGENEYVVYPIMAIKATSVGSYSNDTGVKLFVDLDNMDTTMANNIGALPYTFGAVKKTYGQDTVSPVLSFFQNQFETFVAKENAQDKRVARNVYFDDIIGKEYDGKLPYSIRLFSENIKEVGELIQDIEHDDDTLIDPYLVNLTEPYNIEGAPMPHVVFSEEEDSIYLNSTRILYLEDGSDGDIDDATIEELTRQYIKDRIYPELYEQPRYPFTHVIDTGVSIDTKRAFIQFLGDHDAHKVILSTQDANMGRWNTKNEDLSMGSALYADCLLQPESIIKGTECCRAEIYQQCGHLADSTYRDIIPSTLDIMLKKSRWQSTQSITGQAAGLPHSEITLFKDWNWTPCDADHRQRSWDSGLNYFQHYDMTSVHWPAMRTVYRFESSVLANALFTDVIVYAKHIARFNWSRFTGVEMEFSLLATKAASALSNDLSTMINGFYNFNVQFIQTEEQARIGYESSAIIKIWGHPQQRVWKIDFECYRTGFDPNSVEEVA